MNPKPTAGWTPTREDRLRARDRAAVRRARTANRPLLLLLVTAGPGILVMLAENDGPSILSYAATGATYGVGFFVPFILATFFMAYVVQEMTVRIGIASHRGHADLIASRFGGVWGAFALGDLFVGNLLTLVSEFIAIAGGCAYFGIPPVVAVGAGILLLMSALAVRRYYTWERALMVLACGNLLFVPAALYAHPSGSELVHALATWGPLPGGFTPVLVTLVLANVGATVTPWMLFFQQSAVVDKGLTRADLFQGRLDTALGAVIAAAVAVAVVVACAPLFTHRIDTSSLSNGADFATALRPYLGTTGAALFALGTIEAGLLAAMTISTSSAYAVGEVARTKHSLNASFSEAGRFYVAALASALAAAAIVLLPGAPLLTIALMVNVIATLLMPPALLLLLVLANDREVMGALANTPRQNLFAGVVSVAIALLGAAYGTFLVSRQLGWHG